MANTVAQRRARSKYSKKLFRVSIEFYGTDQALIDHMRTVPNKSRYIKRLIDEDIMRNKMIEEYDNE